MKFIRTIHIVKIKLLFFAGVVKDLTGYYDAAFYSAGITTLVGAFIFTFAELYYIGGSRGGREGRTPPPGRPNSFDFMQFSGKFGVFTPPLEGSRPPLGKILDPPLYYMHKIQR